MSTINYNQKIDIIRFAKCTCNLAIYFGVQLECNIFHNQPDSIVSFLRFENRQGFDYKLTFDHINDLQMENAVLEVVEKAIIHNFYSISREKLKSIACVNGDMI